MNNIWIIVSISYLVGFLFLLKIRSYDKYDKEPLLKLILLTFFGGILAVVIAIFLYNFIQPEENLKDSILIVGPVEELSKLLALYLLYKIYSKDFDEIVDGIIYIAAVSLGFSVIENIQYSYYSDAPYWTLVFRFLFATIGHIAFSVYMGIAFYIHQKIKKNYLGLLLAFLISVLAHGLYDGFIYTKNLEFLFLIIYLFAIYYLFKLLKVSYAYSKQKKHIKQILKPKFSNETFFECCNCGSNRINSYMIENNEIFICNQCEHIILDIHSLKPFLRYYRPKFKVKKIFSDNEYFIKNIKGLDFYPRFKRFNTNLEQFTHWLKIGNSRDIILYTKSLEGKIFSLLGFRFLK